MRILIEHLVSYSDWTFGIVFWLNIWYLILIEHLVLYSDWTFGILFWLNIWYLILIVHLVSYSDWTFGILFWLNIWYLILIEHLVSYSDWTFGIFKLFIVKYFSRLCSTIKLYPLLPYWFWWFILMTTRNNFNNDHAVSGFQPIRNYVFLVTKIMLNFEHSWCWIGTLGLFIDHTGCKFIGEMTQ